MKNLYTYIDGMRQTVRKRRMTTAEVEFALLEMANRVDAQDKELCELRSQIRAIANASKRLAADLAPF